MTNDMKQQWNDMLDAIDERLDNAGDAVQDAADDTGNWFQEQWNNLKSAYHDAVADNADDADEAFEHRMKATEAKAKEAGYSFAQDM